VSIYQKHAVFQGPGQVVPIHWHAAAPTAPCFADVEPRTYKGSITHSVSHNEQTATVGTDPRTDPRTDPLNHPVCSREAQEVWASSINVQLAACGCPFLNHLQRSVLVKGFPNT